MITFPRNSPQILGIKVGQNGQYAKGVTETEMELGVPKKRVRNSRPVFLANVTLLCTELGKLHVMDFYLVDAKQETNYFKWPSLHGFDDDALMRFTVPPKVVEKIVGGEGLHEISIALAVRELPDAALAKQIYFVGTDEEFAALIALGDGLDLQPQLDAWAGIELAG